MGGGALDLLGLVMAVLWLLVGIGGLEGVLRWIGLLGFTWLLVWLRGLRVVLGDV